LHSKSSHLGRREVKNLEDKQTKILTLENIAFYNNDIELPHLQASTLSSADQVLIIFVVQKNGHKNNTTTQWKTNNNILCPVVQWAALVQRFSNYPGAKPVTPVSAVWVHNRILHVTSKIIKSALCNSIMAAGKTKLHIHCHEVGTHSIRAGTAIAMYLKGVPVFAIMMSGQWWRTAFMKYIRKQIKELTINVSKNMLTMQHFCHALNATSSPKKKEYGSSAKMLVQNVA
jgi:hypothetical protein